MKFSNLCKGIQSGKITLDTFGHQINRWGGSAKNRILRHYQECLDGAAGKKDGAWTRSDDMETTNLRMREFYQERLDCDIATQERYSPITHSVGLDRIQCQKCGHRLNWVLEGKKLALKEYFDSKLGCIVILNSRCKKPVPHHGEIKVSSKLIFADAFRVEDEYRFQDAPEDKEYDEEYSLESHQGRKGITAHLEKQNVAYGQMSNMAYGVFVNSKKDSIILGPTWTSSGQDRKTINGHKLVGEVSCNVWRWMAADLDTLKKYDTPTHQDMVSVDAKKGVWEFTHYFDLGDCDPGQNMKIYATLKLKE